MLAYAPMIEKRISMSLGKRIARLRQERSQTLQDVATGAGLTPSFLSRLERDHVNISVANLRKLAQFFGVQMTYFFEGEDSGPSVVVVRAAERSSLSKPSAAAQIYALTPPFSYLDMRLVETPPGANYVVDGDQVLFVLAGWLRCHIGNETYDLDTGDTLVVQHAREVRWEVVGEKQATVLVAHPTRDSA
jgi:transcriptional regulator with XRE-family HTH domain